MVEMVLCPECGALLKENSSVCWNCGCKVERPSPIAGAETNPEEEKDAATAKDWFATFLMMVVPLLAYYIVYLKGL
ncbi:MAG: Double zinc ribbon [Firmicutes bacterium]|nr:Double zinc ribbon [Bacillota bacterium]